MVITLILRSVCFIPLMNVLVRSAYCDYFTGSMIVQGFSDGERGHRCVESPYIVFIIISLFLVCVVTFQMILTYLFYPNRLISINEISSSPTGRWRALWVFLTMVLIPSKLFYSSSLYYVRMFTPLVGIFVNFLLFLYIAIQLPYYWKIANFLTGLTFAIAFSGQLTTLVTEIIASTNASTDFKNVFISTFLLCSLLIVTVISLTLLSLRTVLFYYHLLIFKKRRKVSGIRLSSKETFDSFLSYLSSDDLSDMVDLIPKMYPKSLKIRSFLILRILHHNNFDVARLRALVASIFSSDIARVSVAADIRYYLFHICERVREIDFVSGKHKIAVVKMISRATKHEHAVRRDLRHIFHEYLSERVSVSTLRRTFTQLVENDSACLKIYKDILKRHGDSHLVMSRYGQYLVDICLDSVKGEAYLDTARAIRGQKEREREKSYDVSSDISSAAGFSSLFNSGNKSTSILQFDGNSCHSSSNDSDCSVKDVIKDNVKEEEEENTESEEEEEEENEDPSETEEIVEIVEEEEGGEETENDIRSEDINLDLSNYKMEETKQSEETSRRNSFIPSIHTRNLSSSNTRYHMNTMSATLYDPDIGVSPNDSNQISGSISALDSDFHTTVEKSKKTLTSKMKHESWISISSLCLVLTVIFLVSATCLIATFSVAIWIHGIITYSNSTLRKFDPVIHEFIHVGISATEIYSASASSSSSSVHNYTSRMLQTQKTRLGRLCKGVLAKVNTLYRDVENFGTNVQPVKLFYQKAKFEFELNELNLIDAIRGWSKHCDRVISSSVPLTSSSNASFIFLYMNSETLASVLRGVVVDVVDMVYDDTSNVGVWLWCATAVLLLTYPLILPLIIYFWAYQRTLLKFLLAIPKDAIFDTYLKFGGRESKEDATSSASSSSSAGATSSLCLCSCDVVSKLCGWVLVSFILCVGGLLVMTVSNGVMNVEYKMNMLRISKYREYVEQMDLIQMYLKEFKFSRDVATSSLTNSSSSLRRLRHAYDSFTSVHDTLRFGTENIVGADEVIDLSNYYYDRKCDIDIDINVEIGINSGEDKKYLSTFMDLTPTQIKCLSFNEIVLFFRELVIEYIATSSDRVFSMIRLYETDFDVFHLRVNNIVQICDDEFEEFHNLVTAIIVGTFVWCIIVFLFLFGCVLFGYHAKIRTHLFRIRSCFLYLPDAHLHKHAAIIRMISSRPPSVLPCCGKIFETLSFDVIEMKNRKLSELVEELPTYAILIFDSRGKISFVNNEARDMFGLKAKCALYGMGIESIFVRNDEQLLRWMKNGEGSTFTCEVEMHQKIGRGERHGRSENLMGYSPSPSHPLNKNDAITTLSELNKVAFTGRMTVIRKKQEYLAVIKNIEAELRQKQLVQFEKKKSEEYLFHILPRKIAEEWLEKNISLSSSNRNLNSTAFVTHQEVTVVFLDMVGFTDFSSHTQPELLIAILNEIFEALDMICLKNSMEKIKTIGDAYLAACGVPEYVHGHVHCSFRFAMECIKFLHMYNFRHDKEFKMRCGMHVGKCIAGIMGRQKLQFDIHGDAVNLAARMEQTGVPNKIQVTRECYVFLYKDFNFEEREVDVKGKGRMKTYVYEVANDAEEVKSKSENSENEIDKSKSLQSIINLRKCSVFEYDQLVRRMSELGESRQILEDYKMNIERKKKKEENCREEKEDLKEEEEENEGEGEDDECMI